MGKKDRQRKLKNQAKGKGKGKVKGKGKGAVKTVKVVKKKIVKKEEPPQVVAFQVGNTSSRLAYQIDDKPDLIPAECGSRVIPSCIALPVAQDEGTVVGSAAYQISLRNPERTVTGMAAQMAAGEPVSSKAKLSGPDAYATVLAYLKKIGKEVLDRSAENALVVVADSATKTEQATIEAAATSSICGFKRVFFVPQSVAACLAYGCDSPTTARPHSQLYVVANIGGTSTCLTVVETLNGLLRPVSTTGRISYGGNDAVDAVFNHFLKLAAKKMPKLLEPDVAAKSLTKLREACIFAIHSLSKSTKAQVHVEALSEGQDFRAPISQGLLNMLIGAKANAVLGAAAKELFAISSLQEKAIAGVIISGGGGTIPSIQKRLVDQIVEASQCKRRPEILASIEPAEVCATGAAIQAKCIEKALVAHAKDAKKTTAFLQNLKAAQASAGSFKGTITVNGTAVASGTAPLPLNETLELADVDSVTVVVNDTEQINFSTAKGAYTVTVTVPITGVIKVVANNSDGEQVLTQVIAPANTDSKFVEPEEESEAEDGDDDDDDDDVGEIDLAALAGVANLEDLSEDEDSEEESFDPAAMGIVPPGADLDDDLDDDDDDESGDAPAFVPDMMDDDMD